MSSSAPQSGSFEVLPPLNAYMIVGGGIEVWLYGLNCVFFFGALYIVLRRGAGRQRFLLVSTIVLFLTASAHVLVACVQLYHAFIIAPKLQPLLPGTEATDLDIGNVSSTLYGANLALYIVVIVSQNIILIWRMYIVWGHWKWIVVPSMVEAVHIALCFRNLAFFQTPNYPVQSPEVETVSIASVAIDLFFNFGVTGLIIGRLWWFGRRARQVFAGHHGYMSAILTILESGAAYPLVNVATLVFLCMGNIGLSMAFPYITTQLAMLAPLLIIVRSGASSGNFRKKGQVSHASGRSGVVLSHGDTSRAMQVGIQVQVHSDAESGGQNAALDQFQLSEIQHAQDDSSSSIMGDRK